MIKKATKRIELKAAEKRSEAAFTLIELLVVISIIAILAALLIPGGAIASRKMKVARTQAELNKLMTDIETYKMEVGEYPPDNGRLNEFTNDVPAVTAQYQQFAGMNPLYYELSGALFETNTFKVVDSDERVNVSDLRAQFNRVGIRNSARVRADVPFKGRQFKASHYKELNVAGDVEILVAPVPGEPNSMITGRGNLKLNPWRYDSSTIRRNNRQSFDLWADIFIGGKVVRISNWKQ